MVSSVVYVYCFDKWITTAGSAFVTGRVTGRPKRIE